MHPRQTIAVAAVALLGLLTGSSCAQTVDSTTAQTTAHTTAQTTSDHLIEPGARAARTEAGVVVVAVGDIACKPGQPRTRSTCHQAQTARLARKLDPDAVLLLGDNQYEKGALTAYQRSFAASWGSLRGISRPVPGNHEYKVSGARGYYAYFKGRQPGAPGYYAFNLGSWRVYALNSNCDDISCRTERRWLRRNLESHPTACSLFTMHHPRYSSGSEHGSDPAMRTFFSLAHRYDVELVLAGHDHDYERFKRMNATGDRDRHGVMSIVSGAGGKSLYRFAKTAPGSAYRLAGHFGVLRLRLSSDRFRFAFKDVDGTTRDRGRRHCY